MKLYGVPGWACQRDYFNFLPNTHSFDWHFYSNGNSNPEEFIGDIEENFIYICYSMGSLYINEALKNSYCKGIICLSGFLNFCGEGKLEKIIQERVTSMQNELRNKMSKTIVEFRKAAGSEELSAEKKPNYINLCNTLDLLKSSKFMEFNCSLPMLILRGKKDMILHPKVAVQLERKFIDAEQHCIEGAYHDLKNSEEAKTQISNFIKKIS